MLCKHIGIMKHWVCVCTHWQLVEGSLYAHRAPSAKGASLVCKGSDELVIQQKFLKEMIQNNKY